MSSRLLDLPKELRLQIFEICAEDVTAIAYRKYVAEPSNPYHFEIKESNEEQPVRLLGVNKQVRHEFLELLAVKTPLQFQFINDDFNVLRSRGMIRKKVPFPFRMKLVELAAPLDTSGCSRLAKRLKHMFPALKRVTLEEDGYSFGLECEFLCLKEKLRKKKLQDWAYKKICHCFPVFAESDSSGITVNVLLRISWSHCGDACVPSVPDDENWVVHLKGPVDKAEDLPIVLEKKIN